ncbi:hypothetical protein MSMTP_2906 [Methanosarcina sp. MTP4]|nr:hypothetical protein MSMTP_2906 [Methanosarcina sp. MTP4]
MKYPGSGSGLNPPPMEIRQGSKKSEQTTKMFQNPRETAPESSFRTRVPGIKPAVLSILFFLEFFLQFPYVFDLVFLVDFLSNSISFSIQYIF